MNKQHGFTLIELLVTMAIAAVLLKVAVPSMKTLLDNNRLTATTNQLIGSFLYTRSEAVKRGVTTAICTSSDQSSCDATTEWEDGWLIWSDDDGDNTLDAAEIVRVSTGLGGSMTTTSSNATHTWTFDPSGFISEASPGTIEIEDNRGSTYKKCMQLLPTGSLSLITCP